MGPLVAVNRCGFLKASYVLSVKSADSNSGIPRRPRLRRRGNICTVFVFGSSTADGPVLSSIQAAR